MDSAPNIIGATGGSGTRVFARIVRQGGMYIGTELNASEDAIDFGRFSDRWINAFVDSDASPLALSTRSEMADEVMAILERHCGPAINQNSPYGWKEPRSMYLLPFFHEQFPTLKFLHVIRDGRDMAFSSNQNQLNRHGAAFLVEAEKQLSQPLQAMALWTRVNLLVSDYGERNLGDRYLCVRFEDLCSDPEPVIENIFNFLKLSGNIEEIAKLEVFPPQSIGRWKNQDKETVSHLHTIGKIALHKFGYC